MNNRSEKREVMQVYYLDCITRIIGQEWNGFFIIRRKFDI